MATSSIPPASPNAKSEAISAARFGESPSAIGTSAAQVPAIMVGRRLPARPMIRLVNGTTTTRPAGAASSARPRTPSLRCRFCLTAGILASHTPLATPSTAK